MSSDQQKNIVVWDLSFGRDQMSRIFICIIDTALSCLNILLIRQYYDLCYNVIYITIYQQAEIIQDLMYLLISYMSCTSTYHLL